MSRLLLEAPAKINLYLYLTGKRDDGYHLLESLVAFTELADTLEITACDTLKLSVKGEFAEASGNADDNLVLRAARALLAKTGVSQGAQLTLTKNIPVGAGLGGGSADAAAALRGLNRFWKLNLSQQDLRWIASTLGADVAMCLDSMPAIARGIGDELLPLMPPPPKLHLLLVYPRVPLLTKDVYKASRLGDPAPEWNAKSMKPKDFLESLRVTRNHLQRPAITVDSRVAEVLLALETLQPMPELVRMSGSGACCFALYLDKRTAACAHAAIVKQHPQWWAALTSLR